MAQCKEDIHFIKYFKRVIEEVGIYRNLEGRYFIEFTKEKDVVR